ncbi:MAG: hypothetical protein M0C28_40940 [Candidatus Moduliflexus flocculans]|nr:hypothetical protein [Candidatus Moduliflexus flocculans]
MAFSLFSILLFQDHFFHLFNLIFLYGWTFPLSCCSGFTGATRFQASFTAGFSGCAGFAGITRSGLCGLCRLLSVDPVLPV